MYYTTILQFHQQKKYKKSPVRETQGEIALRKDEAVVRIVGKLDLLYGDFLEQHKVREIIEEVLYDYELVPMTRELVVQNNMQDKILLYLASKKLDGLSIRTLESYSRHLNRFSYCVQKNVEDVVAMDIRVHLANYAKTGVKNSTIATETDILRGFFQWLEDEEYIQKSPMRKIKTPKVEKRVREALTKEEFETLRLGAKTLRQKALLELLYATGCRLEEIEKTNKTDVDWQKLQMRVIGKGDKERTVFINATAQVHIRKYLMSRLDECDALFVTERKPIRRMGRRSIQREIDKIMEQSGLQKNVFPHLIRHTFATHMINAGMPLNVLQEILGHDSPETTLIYANIDNKTIEHEYRKYS